MRLRTYLIVAVSVMLAGPVWAEGISESEAREIASSFMSSHFGVGIGAGPRLAHRAPSTRTGQPAPYYVFNASEAGKGYVIVAGDDRVPQVLGYSDEGAFDYDDVPEAMQEWLDGYAVQIAALDDGAAMAGHIKSSQPIAPLVKANWSQNSPYNILLPFRPNGNHALVGCVATAMAQVMHYWKWPNRTTEPIPAYLTEKLGFYMPELPPVNFDWQIMQDTYYTTDTVRITAQEAATLSLYCAQALQIDFKENTSSGYTSDISRVMPQYFGYSSEARFVHRAYFTSEEWETMILNELKARRPVIYSGSKLSGGHAFICDGYDGNGMFHINWGWNGTDNGYFLLNILNPDIQGPGSASDAHGYIIKQGIIMGLKPGTTSDRELEVFDRNMIIKECVDTRASVNENFTVTQETHFLNSMPDTISFNYAWGLYQDNRLIEVMEPGIKEKLPSLYYTRITSTLSVGSGISSGTYRIVPIYCELNSENWRRCNGCDINYIEVIINGNNCSFIGNGVGTTPDYQVNDIIVEGNMHPNRPVHVTVNLTNNGNTRNDIIYMLAEDKLVSVGYADVEKSATCNVDMIYVPEAAGKVNLKFTFDEAGQQILASKLINIDAMPAANLTGSVTVLNVTDAANKVVTANDFGVNVSIRNAGTTTYDEDITVTLYKLLYEGRGSAVQSVTQHLTLAPRQTQTLTFHLDNVTDGWQYFAYAYYYSAGERITIKGSGAYTIVLPPAVVTGDVNSDGVVNISDINVLINMILSGNSAPTGDVNGDGMVNISDVNATINIILNGN